MGKGMLKRIFSTHNLDWLHTRVYPTKTITLLSLSEQVNLFLHDFLVSLLGP